MHVVVEHRFERTTVDRFIDVYYSEAFNQEVAPLASLKRRELVSEETLEGGKVKRRVRMVPDVRLPGPVQRLLKGAPIEYFEVSVFDPATRTATYAIESQAGDYVKVWGQIAFRPEGSGVVRRIEGDVKVKVLGLGALIERVIAHEVQGRYDAIQAFTQRYLDEHAALAEASA